MIYKSALSESGKEERKGETEWQRGKKEEESQRFPPIDPGGSVQKPEGPPNEGRPTTAECIPVMWPTNHMQLRQRDQCQRGGLTEWKVSGSSGEAE